MSSIRILCCFAIGALGFCGQLAADVRTDGRVSIAEDEVIDDDLYIFAESANIRGTIKGDLIVFAQSVSIRGVVEGDIAVAAQVIELDGEVQDDVRIAGMQLTLMDGAKIGDDLIAAGYSLECQPDSMVAGDVKFAGFQAIYAGAIKRQLDSATAHAKIAGSIGGNAKLSVGSDESPPPSQWFGDVQIPMVPAGLTVTADADLAGDLEYVGPKEADIDPIAKIAGNVDFQRIAPSAAPQQAPRATKIGFQLLSAAKQFVALLLVGLIAIFAFPEWTGQVTERIQKRPLECFLWGVVAVIGSAVTVVLLIALVILGAVALGFASLESLLPAWLAVGIVGTAGFVVSFGVVAVWVSKIIVGLWLGFLLLSGNHWNPKRKLAALLIGLVLFVAVGFVPYFGTALAVLAMLLGIGAVTMKTFGSNVKQVPPAKPLMA